MFRGIGIVVVLLASVLWIGYTGWEFFYKDEKAYTPALLFNDELDSAVLKINFPEELNSFEFFEGDNDYLKLAPNKLEGLTIYFSKKRSLVLFEKAAFWSTIAINELIFNTALTQEEFKGQSGKFICFSKETLRKRGKTEINTIDISDVDKNATANIFDLKSNKRKDIYLQENGTLSYQFAVKSKFYGQPINDFALFSSVLPAEVDTYLFKSHFLALEEDSIYANGVLSEWVNFGFSEISIGSEKALITDYKAQQNPNLVLLQYQNNTTLNNTTEEIAHYSNIQLTKDFPSNKSTGFYLLLINDNVILTERKEVANQIKINYQLGNTVAVNKESSANIFELLTTNVHYRAVNKSKKECTTYLKNKAYTVEAGISSAKNRKSTQAMFSFHTSETIRAIKPVKDHLRNGWSTFVIAEEKYYLVGPNGKEIWSGKLDTLQTSAIAVIDIFQNNKKQITFTNGNKLHVLDLNGNSVNGFPYINTVPFTSRVSSFYLNDQMHFLAGDSKGNLLYLNAKGGELSVFNLDATSLKSAPIVVQEQNKPNCYVKTSKGYLRVLLAQNSVLSVAGEVSNILKEKENVYFMLNKNNATRIQDVDGKNSSTLPVKLSYHQSGLSHLEQNRLKVYSIKGEFLFETETPIHEVSDLKQVKTKSNTYTLILDNIENNVYLFDKTGMLISGFPKEGQARIELEIKNEKELNIYTVIDENLICYTLQMGNV
ncbi:MAG: hypothetical protein ACPGU5_04040 [Lishizhenia sp.]